MRVRPLAIVLFLSLPAPSVVAQTVEERVALLERQVQELRSLHNLPSQPSTDLPVELIGNEHVQWGYPGGNCAFLIKEHYVTCHDGTKRVPAWVTYHLTRENLRGDAARTDDFRADPELPSGERAELADYRNSGYDRGHMAPAAAFKRSRAAMSETFLLSNIAPQRPSLNRRIWQRLEADVRSMADAHGSIWVYAGSLYLDDDRNPTEPTTFIGPNRLAVPTHFYKVILCQHASGSVEMFAFLMENKLQPLSGDPRDYLESVDLIEAFSGLDFFAEVPDPDEERLEATVATNWPIN